MNSELIMVTMKLFWNKGIDKVSPGAFGMVTRGKPYDKAELEYAVNRCPGVKWDGDWIVKE